MLYPLEKMFSTAPDIAKALLQYIFVSVIFTSIFIGSEISTFIGPWLTLTQKISLNTHEIMMSEPEDWFLSAIYIPQGDRDEPIIHFNRWRAC
jgi:hypothetical protein